MRFGCCLNMTASGPDGTGIERVARIAEIGYDYVELPLAELTALPKEKFQEVKRELANSGLRCETCNNFFPGTLQLTGPQVDSGRIKNYVEMALGRANELGVQYLVFGSGKAKNVPEGFSLEDGYRQVAGLLKEVAPAAEKSGITIVIEPLRKAECNLINTFEEGCRLAGDVSHPHVKVLVDFYHLSVEKEPVEHLAAMGKENLRHVHFADPVGRVYPEEVKMDYIPFFQALKEIGYNERISCEAYVTNFDVQAEKALGFFKKIMLTI